ncbi:ABC-2 family transporter protein [Candidatus Daviesbacteria bacterium]|nr:ABC-2 family transporter protein [Candidatus Daviesbacteria bacterium]
MRYVRIFLLNLEHIFENRARSFVWFLIPLISSSLLLLFWNGALGNKNLVAGWNFQSFATYYLLLLIASSLLMSHIEENVGIEDIRQGQLAMFITKPFSYFWLRFFSEIPFRILQGFYGIIVLILAALFLKSLLNLQLSWQTLLISLTMAILAYFISFIFKMVMGLIAFWLIDINGIFQLFEIIIVLFGGYVAPLAVLPNFLSETAKFLPFAYMIYFPIISFQGKLNFQESFQILSIQVFWILVFALTYRFLWNKGLQKFTGVGQ